MKSRESLDRSPSRRGRVSGMSLVEVIVAVLIIGASFGPMLSLQRQHLERSRSNQRLTVAESLVRDAIENLRWRKRNNGFLWLWNNVGDTTTTSGISNAGGSGNANPQIPAQYRMPNPDATGDRFDRVVQIRRRWSNVPDPQLTGSGDPNAGPDLDPAMRDILFLEVLVTVYCQDDFLLKRPGSGQRAFYQIVTYIADFPAS